MTLHPLLDRLAREGARIGADWHPAAGDQALLFAGDPVRFPESLDVAVVLPELRAACASPFAIGVVDPDSEDELARRFGVQRRPSVVFLRDGGWLDTVAGMHDWDAFVALTARALAKSPSRPPIALRAEGAPASCQAAGAGAA